MKKIILNGLCLMLAGYTLHAQTSIFSYGSAWKYLDNGTDQGTAWRSLTFDDTDWKTGNGKFGYGLSGLTSNVSYGPNANQKYLTTYFRKMIFLANASGFTAFPAGIMRDDGVVVYVNGVEVYRSNMPTGSITYLTSGKDAEDNGTVTQAFTINKAAFVNGNNVIAVEIHQKTVTNGDLAFDMQLSGNEPFIDLTPPSVVSISRQMPASELTDTTAVTYRVLFSEKVRGVDAADFMIVPSGGNARGTLTKVGLTANAASLTDAVKLVGPDSTTYDVTIRGIAGSGVLRLDMKNNNTGITDAAGNAFIGGFTNGQVYTINASSSQGFNSFMDINSIAVSTQTREVPQAKLWNYAGKWWTVLATSGGTKLLRLDSTSWTDVLTVATATNTRADCKVVGNLVHILLFRGASSTSYFASLEYDAALHTYKRWTQRTSNVNIVFESGTITATLDLDTTGKIWIASNSSGNMLARWSAPPYSIWSSPILIASGATSDDICAVTALSGKIGIFWSNQSAKRFGFKTHNDGADPTIWSTDEVPASQSALSTGGGMADNYVNVLAASDGTLYCAVKTGYDKSGLPTLALLVRRPNNTWDDLYPVTSSKEGNRPIVMLNEATGKIKVIYSAHITNFDGSRSADILYRESSTSAISFGAPITLISGNGLYNHEYTFSTHQAYNSAIVIMTTNESVNPLSEVGVLATDETLPEILARVSTAPALSQEPVQQTIPADSYKIKWLARPNPFATGTTIDFSLSQSDRYTIILYDSRGRRITVLKQGWGEAGIRNAVSIDGSHLANGLYLVKIQTGREIQTLKLLKR
jgi:hypothetical protein